MVAGVELLVECCPSFRGTDNSSTCPYNRCSFDHHWSGYRSVVVGRCRIWRSFAPSPPPRQSLLLFPLSFFFRLIMTFSAEFRCYIGCHTLVPWPTALAVLLPPWPTALGHNVVAHGARPLTPWGMALCLSHTKGPLLAAPTAVGHDVMSLSPWGRCIFCKISDGPHTHTHVLYCTLGVESYPTPKHPNQPRARTPLTSPCARPGNWHPTPSTPPIPNPDSFARTPFPESFRKSAAMIREMRWRFTR
jgi:hypothetical protein